MNKKALFLKQQNYLLFSLVMLVLVILILFRLQNFPLTQFRILIVLVLGYFGWALYHHYRDKSLTLEIIVEYVLTTLLVTVILLGLIF